MRKTITCLAVALTFSVQANCWAVPQTVNLSASKDVSLFQNNVNNSSGAANKRSKGVLLVRGMWEKKALPA